MLRYEDQWFRRCINEASQMEILRNQDYEGDHARPCRCCRELHFLCRCGSRRLCILETFRLQPSLASKQRGFDIRSLNCNLDPFFSLYDILVPDLLFCLAKNDHATSILT